MTMMMMMVVMDINKYSKINYKVPSTLVTYIHVNLLVNGLRFGHYSSNRSTNNLNKKTR